MIRIGTRSSRLAIIQANMVKAALSKKHGLSNENIEIVTINTTGDKLKENNLSTVGGKGLFVKELEESLLANEVDIAVHSLKDVPAIIPSKLRIAGVLVRHNPLDAFLSPHCNDFINLPKGAVLGTSSPRRAAQVLNLRPDLKIVPFRGNVDKRLEKLKNNIADATILAAAGLERLGYDKKINVISADQMIPAVGQGVICMECRDSDKDINKLVNEINHDITFKLALCERIFLEGLGGNCRTPIGGYASSSNDQIEFIAMIGKFDGSEIIRAKKIGKLEEYEAVGKDVLNEIKSEMTEDFFEV